MSECDHKEADTRICVHIMDALDKTAKKIYVRTVDTDVIVGIFSELQRKITDIDVWVAFGMGRHFQFYHINSICGERACPFFMLSLALTQVLSFLVRPKNPLGPVGSHFVLLLKHFYMLLTPGCTNSAL